jgi:hypothetical protein
MAAIDLLFDVKRDSERLHQLVLGALLQRTALLSRLVPLPSVPTALQLHWEPEGKAYDLGLTLGGGDAKGAAAGRRGRVLVEIKLDGAVNEDQLAQQCNPSRLHAEDRLLYLLLGYSAMTSDRTGLRERVRRIGEHSGRPELLDRVSLRDADDLIPLLADPALLPFGPDHADARDLAAAYRDALLALAERTRRFAERPLAEWQDGDYFGFFAACRARSIAGMGRARIGRASGPDGSVVQCSFAETPLSGGVGTLELQFENARLVVRLHATAERKALRQRVLDALVALGVCGEAKDPAKELDKSPDRAAASATEIFFEPAPLRLSSSMAVAQREGLLSGFPDRFDWGQLAARVAAAEAALRKVASHINP